MSALWRSESSYRWAKWKTRFRNKAPDSLKQGSHIRKNGYRAARNQNRIKVRRDRWVTVTIVRLGSISSQRVYINHSCAVSTLVRSSSTFMETGYTRSLMRGHVSTSAGPVNS